MKPGFFPYLLAGYPDWPAFENLFDLTCRYADTIELGIPFSDPVADGPIIRKAATKVLSANFTVERVFEFLQGRHETPPVAIMSYANPVLAYGRDTFFKKCVQASVKHLILPDIPYEESADWKSHCKDFHLSWISFVSLVTRPDRLRRIAESAEGFIYFLSLTGITGAEIKASETIRQKTSEIRKHTDVPIALGFGIKSVTDVEPFRGLVDAFIIGSRIIELAGESLECVEKFYREFKSGIGGME